MLAVAAYLVKYSGLHGIRAVRAALYRCAWPHYYLFAMKKEQLARQLAKESGITPAAAADQVDRIVTAILKRVRKGESAPLPGIGTFLPGRNREFRLDRSLPFQVDRKKARKACK